MDTNILIGELLRMRGLRYLTGAPHLYVTSQRVISEARYELPRRIARIAVRGGQRDDLDIILNTALAFINEQIEVIPTASLLPLETEARLRVPRDPNDWELVAVALLTEAGLWTADADFLGCGLPTWSTPVLHVLHPA